MEKLRMPYRQAYDAIITAYYKDEIKPYDSDFCFCGTLCPESERVVRDGKFQKNWNVTGSDYSSHFFEREEYMRMEKALLLKLGARPRTGEFNWMTGTREGDKGFEDKLFDGMCVALDEMRNIYLENGLPVEEGDELFYKREIKHDKREAHIKA